MAAIATYAGAFGAAEAERLLWRAGFGPRPGEAQALAGRGLVGAVRSLTRPGREKLIGPAPHDDDGVPLAPVDAYGHDHLWWLDRMVRTSRPLVERMALVWHDWFATSNENVASQRLMIGQNGLFRREALGSFERLLLGVTKDPAMLIFLSGIDSTKDAPNENYGRELMELFTLGADRSGGYTEDDVRQQARALTGFTAEYKDNVGFQNFHFDAGKHDAGPKTVFGRKGRWSWQDACRLCLGHGNHPSFFIRKLWSYFIPIEPAAETQRALERLYVKSRYAVAPVVEAILLHPDLYQGPTMVKPPVVYTAGLLRALGRGIDTTAWVSLDQAAGQMLFYPPNVAGWDDDRWLDTASFKGRWYIADAALAAGVLDESSPPSLPTEPEALLKKALASVGGLTVSPATRAALSRFVRSALADADEDWKQEAFPAMVFNAVRQLAVVSPDQQVC
jgi:uncharacterized protein (DUF1800 family)